MNSIDDAVGGETPQREKVNPTANHKKSDDYSIRGYVSKTIDYFKYSVPMAIQRGVTALTYGIYKALGGAATYASKIKAGKGPSAQTAPAH